MKHAPRDKPKNYHHVVFMGLHNPDKFRAKISNWLSGIDLSGTAIYVADNGSAISPESWVRELLEAKGVYYQYIQNDRNYGGYGSLIRNLERLKEVEWITTLHQDDWYAQDHVQGHRQVVKGSGAKLGVICSESISEDTDGRVITYPRGSWLLNDRSDEVGIFLAHLRSQIYPFSGATFRTSILRDYPIPWHSTAFPDTELIMKIAPRYEIKFAEGRTVRYLENPLSESHALTSHQRDFGAFQALIRVFTHEAYSQICEKVAPHDQEKFLKSLVQGIEIRFSDKSMAAIFCQTALEITSTHFGINGEMADFLIEGYRRAGDSAAVSILAGVSNSADPAATTDEPLALNAPPASNNNLSKLALVLMRIIPRTLRKTVVRGIMRTRLGRRTFPQWNFRWKD